MPLSEIGIVTKVWPETARALSACVDNASPHGIAGRVLDEVVRRGLLPSILAE